MQKTLPCAPFLEKTSTNGTTKYYKVRDGYSVNPYIYALLNNGELPFEELVEITKEESLLDSGKTMSYFVPDDSIIV